MECVMLVQLVNIQLRKDLLNVKFVPKMLNVQVKIKYGSMKVFGETQQIHQSFMNVLMNLLVLE